jgi:monovalent cation:H+ antiporter-2, CPA2 family
MTHDMTLITTVAVSFALAFVLGYIANFFRLPPLVGYLVAGVVVGPYTPGFVADSAMTGQLAEIGVMLLMFGVGLHFSIADLMAVRRLAIPGAIAQILLATAMGVGMMMLSGWSFGSSLVLGLSLSVASTVVLLKALEERGTVTTPNGRIAVGWLIVEDLAMVLALVLLPPFAQVLGGHASSEAHAGGGESLWLVLGLTLVKVSSFIAISLTLGPRIMPWILRQVARTGSRELFTLSVLAIAIGIAYGASKFFGVSFALGAFFAGMVLHESDLSHKAATNSLPLQDAFAVLFFVSVGMMFDPYVVMRAPLMVAAVVLLILVSKSLAALGIVMALGYPMSTALTVSASLAQVGEFSFILASLGMANGLMEQEGMNLILAGSLISITLNPIVFAGTDRLSKWVRSQPKLKRDYEDTRQKHFQRLQGELETARLRAEAKAAARMTFTPEELAERFPLFTGLTPEQREVLVLHFKLITAQPGERIIRAGEAADAVYFISEGEVEVSFRGRKINRLQAGDYFGEMALITGQPRSADVTALDYSKFATLSQRDFRRFLERFPDIRKQMSQIAAERGEMNRQILEEMTDNDGESSDEKPS